MKSTAAVLLLCLFAVTTVYGKNKVMPWMCLERCGDNSTQIDDQIHQIRTHLDAISGVSFELYNLGENCTLVVNNLTEVGPILKQIGVETYPMVSSYPYPPQFLDWMRQLFANPKPFIDAAIAEIQKYDFTGYNVDFEPTVNATPEDAKEYAAFLGHFADELHKINKKLTADIASWNPIWNWTLIARSSIDKVFTMSTYTGNWTLFQNNVKRGVAEIGIQKLGIGLETVNPNTNKPFTEQEMYDRFRMIQQYRIQEVDIWRSPIPENWWRFIHAFVHQ